MKEYKLNKKIGHLTTLVFCPYERRDLQLNHIWRKLVRYIPFEVIFADVTALRETEGDELSFLYK
jgi:hypothetical protein